MAYVPLALSDSLPESVDTLIRKGVEPLLQDVRWMLATAIRRPREFGPPRQLQIPIALMLLATVDGVSKQLFRPEENMGGGKKFKECLNRFFPWDIDPPTGVSSEEAAIILYETFRNPLVHFLGLHRSKNPAVQIVQSFPGSDSAEIGVERMERSKCKPVSEPCLVVTPDKRQLWLDPFYWGVRTLVERWSHDKAQVSHADKQFTKPVSERRV